ncbi:MAG TPA: hypothetical protein VGH03_10760 [Caulobacteraceae bacterium]|jgi:hypothetical protein
MKPSAAIRQAAVIALATALVSSGAHAQTPDATIHFTSHSVAFIAGGAWGGGTLHYRGHNYPLKVGGMSVGEIGVKKTDASGNVYHLTRVSDIEGTYAALAASATVGAGAGGLTMKNGKGVLIKMTGMSMGANLKIGPSGLSISLKK